MGRIRRSTEMRLVSVRDGDGCGRGSIVIWGSVKGGCGRGSIVIWGNKSSKVDRGLFWSMIADWGFSRRLTRDCFSTFSILSPENIRRRCTTPTLFTLNIRLFQHLLHRLHHHHRRWSDNLQNRNPPIVSHYIHQQHSPLSRPPSNRFISISPTLFCALQTPPSHLGCIRSVDSTRSLCSSIRVTLRPQQTPTSRKGIQPFVTIHHGDLPQELEDKYGSWLSSEMQEEYLYLAETCFKSFGDRVKHWITINEPKLTTEFAYELGIIPPSRCSQPFGNCLEGNSDVEPIIVMHNLLLAHGRAAKLYHENFQPKQGGSIGLTVNANMYKPLTNGELDREAAKRAFVFRTCWSLDPSIFGEYPEELKEYLGSALPSFSLDEKKFMKNSLDFIGINHYSTVYAVDCTTFSCSAKENRSIQGFVGTVGERNGVLIGELMGLPSSYVVPTGMEEVVNILKIRYNNTPMFITENGYSSPDLNEHRVNELTNDIKRVEYHAKYLASLAKAIRGGADVRGYFAWSLMDNYEWVLGYSVKFGLYYVDRKTLTRIPKLSARWYKKFLSNYSDNVEMKTSRDKLNSFV